MVQSFLWGYSLAVLLLLAGLALALLFFNYRKRKALRRKGLSELRGLRTTLNYLQQHRGLTSGFLRGDLSLERALLDTRSRVDSQIALIESRSTWIIDLPAWQAITTGWAKLTAEFRFTSADPAFKAHCRLVSEVLNLIADVAKYHHLNDIVSQRTKRPVGYLWHHLLATAELLGQTRSLGVSIAAINFSSNHSQSELTDLMAKVDSSVASLKEKVTLPEQFTPAYEHYRQVYTEQLMVLKPTIEAIEVFQVVSAVIDVLYDHYKEEQRYLTEVLFRD